VGAVIKDERGRLLLIKRGHEQGADLWSPSGERIEPGETDADAMVRKCWRKRASRLSPDACRAGCSGAPGRRRRRALGGGRSIAAAARTRSGPTAPIWPGSRPSPKQRFLARH